MKRRRLQDEEARWVRAVLDPGAASGVTDRNRPPADETAWRATWAGLELPPAPPVPAGFARRVALAWSAERERAEAPILGALWMRAAAAAALVAGIMLGSTLAMQNGLDLGSGALPASLADEAAADEDSWTATLSEEYLLALSSDETSPASPAAGASPSQEGAK
jgi:hypothetical protein